MLMTLKRLLTFRAFNYKILNARNSYIVLLPEVPADTPETNSLLRHESLPSFSDLTADKCVHATGKLIIDYEAGIHSLDQKLQDTEIEKNVQNVILPLDRLASPLDYAWGAFKALSTVRQNDNVAVAYSKLHPRIIRAKQEKYLCTTIHKAFKELKAKEKEFTEPVQRIIDKYLLESRLFGMDLLDNEYSQFTSTTAKLHKHRNSYNRKVIETSRKFAHNLEYKDVRNFPRELLKCLAEDPTNASKGPWKLSLDPYVYRYFLKHCDDRLLRWNAWFAFNIRASSISGPDLNNSVDIEEIRHQRNQLAKILGFKTFAELSMKTKMAGSVETVQEMITTLHIKSKETTQKELQELQDFAAKSGFQHVLQLWDIPYWQRLHKDELFTVDDDAVRQYFPLPTVLDGLFKLCRILFDINIKEHKEKIDTWHEDVKVYKIYDSTGKEIASFFLDLYSRSGEKIQGSWLEIGRNRSDVIDSAPLSYLIFNFHPPVFGKPSLLSFDDLKILLRKFGHLLQHSLTTIPYNEVAGMTNLEWDVVNVCPYVLSSFLRHYRSVAMMSGHVESGMAIPQEMHIALNKRNLYMEGFRLTEELYLSALDLEMYSKNDFWLNLTKSTWAQYMPFEYEKEAAQPCSFSEIFSGNYPAAYFSNLWAEMIAADIFSAFEEAGLDDEESLKQISHRFRDTFLCLGGGCHPGEVFRKFRGRDPSIEALLVSSGIVSKSHC